jgi:uncharacterized membrane protein YeaQ/YmgE (transglycosylase-associated protein family)
MDIITLLVVGLVAGVLATTVVGRGFGLLGDIVLGIVGAFVGAYSFRALGWHAPFSGLAGVIAVAFVGAVILLVGLRLIHRSSSRR